MMSSSQNVTFEPTVSSEEEVSLAEQIAFNIINAFIGVLGLLGNGLVISVFISNWKAFQSLTHLLILHQSIIDFISSLVFTLLRMDRWQPLLDIPGTVGEIACRLWHSEYPLWALFMTSTLNLVLLSTERYIAVVYPVYHLNKLTRTKIKISMVIIWTVSFSYQSYLAFTTTNLNGQCVLGWEDGTESIQTFVGILTFLLEYLCPLCIMSIEYILIAVKLREMDKTRERRRRETLTLRNSEYSSTVSPAPPSLSARGSQCSLTPSMAAPTLIVEQNENEHVLLPNQNGSQNTSTTNTPRRELGQRVTSQRPSLSVLLQPHFRRISSAINSIGQDNKFSRPFRNVIRTLIVVFVVNVVCWTPAEFEYFIYNLGGNVDFDSVFHKMALVLILCNMVCNPFVYCVQYKEFQRSFRRTFCVCKRRNRVGLDVAA